MGGAVRRYLVASLWQIGAVSTYLLSTDSLRPIKNLLANFTHLRWSFPYVHLQKLRSDLYAWRIQTLTPSSGALYTPPLSSFMSTSPPAAVAGPTSVGAHVAIIGSLSETDIYFSADVETDGPIPGPFSMLSFALVTAGSFDGNKFIRPAHYNEHFYAELCPISEQFEIEALEVNGLDRIRLLSEGADPYQVMTAANQWIEEQSKGRRPVLVAYPLSFDWTWLYWYFVKFSKSGSPFEHSRCYDLKTAFAVKANIPICRAGRSKIPNHLRSARAHTHHALDDAVEQAELFANIFEWRD